MSFKFLSRKRSQAQGFGKSEKKKRWPRATFRLEGIKTPLVVGFLGGQDFDPIHELLKSVSLSDLHLPDISGALPDMGDAGNSDFLAGSGAGICPINPPPVTPQLPFDGTLQPPQIGYGGENMPPVSGPGLGELIETLPPPFVWPIDPPGDSPTSPQVNPRDFPLANHPVIAIIDTGFSNNPDNDRSRVILGRDRVSNDDNPILSAGEGNEHGTFVRGIIGGTRNNGIGIDGINDIAPLWLGRAIGSGKWWESLIEFVDAVKKSGQPNGLVNFSFDLTQQNPDGSVTTRYEFTPEERSALEYARQNHVLIVAAAGNDSGVMSVLGQASQEFDNIITVGAADGKNRAAYSSYGRGLDILAAGGTPEKPEWSTVGDGVGTMAGTSVATAKVTGAASLVWAANPGLNYRQVVEILKSTAMDLSVPGWDEETGAGLLDMGAAVELAKVTAPEVYNPTPWYAPDTWSGEGKVTPEERAAQGGNSIATATVQVSTTFSDSDRLDLTQPEKYYQFTVNEPGYVRWNFTSLNPVSGAGRPDVTIIKADGSSASHRFQKGAITKMIAVREGQTSFSDGNFYDPGTYYLKVGNSAFKDYNISTQFIADGVSSFAGNIQYRTQPYKSLDDSRPSAIFSGPTVSELKNLSGVVTYDNIQFNDRIAKYGFEVNESGKFRINLNSPNGKMELNIYKFIGSEDKPVYISGFGGVSANSDQWLEVELNKGRYEIEVKTPSDNWLEPDWNWNQQTLVRPYTLNATFTPNAPQPGQGKVPSSAGVFNKTVVSNNGVVNHYYANGYLTVQPSGQATWFSYAFGVVSTSVQRINEPVPLTDPDGNYSIQTSKVIFASADLNDGIDHKAVGGSIGGNLDREDYYRFTLDKISDVDIQLSGDNASAKFYLAKDVNGNGKIDYGEALQGANQGNNIKNISRSLGPGTYYVVVSSDDRVNQTKYNLNVDTKPETAGNSLLYAQDIGLLSGSKTFKGLVDSKVDTYDYYRFNLDETSNVNLKLDKLISEPFADIEGVSPFVSVELINLTTGEILQSAAGNSSSAASINRLLQAGSYYVRVNSSETNGYASYELSLDGEPAYKKPIDAEYARYQGLLGSPTGGYWQAGDSPMGTKGYGQNYDHGHVFWTAQSGAIALWYGFADTYNQTGGSNGWLGFPTQGKRDWEGGQRIEFEGGYIYWTEKEGARAFKKGELPWEKSIAAEYAGYQGLLGNPTTNYWQAADSPNGTKGYGQNYDHGHVFWTAQSGAIALWHDFADTYNQTGGSNNWLGFPTKGKYDWKDGQRIDFEGGYIYWTPQSGAKAYHTGETPNTNTANNGPTINQKPIIINFPNFEMPYGASFSLQTYANQLQISDPDGDAIQFYEISVDPSRVDMEAWTLEGQPLGKYLIPADKFNTIKFYGSFLGSNPVVVRAFDGKEWSDSKSFNITVVPSSNTGGVAITPGNGGSPLTNSPSPTPEQPVSGKGVAIRTGSSGNSGNNPENNGGGSKSGNGNSGGGYNPIPGIIAPPIVSIGSVSKNQPEYTSKVKPGDVVKVTGNTNTDNMEFYVGSKKVLVNKSINLDTGDFSALFTVPNDLPSGDYTIFIVAKNQLGLSQEFNSSSWITIVGTKFTPEPLPNIDFSVPYSKFNYAISFANQKYPGLFGKEFVKQLVDLAIDLSLGVAIQAGIQAIPAFRVASWIVFLSKAVQYSSTLKRIIDGGISLYKIIGIINKIYEFIDQTNKATNQKQLEQAGEILAEAGANLPGLVLDMFKLLNECMVGDDIAKNIRQDTGGIAKAWADITYLWNKDKVLNTIVSEDLDPIGLIFAIITYGKEPKIAY